jgi:hypothetical protein
MARREGSVFFCRRRQPAPTATPLRLLDVVDSPARVAAVVEGGSR